MKRKSSDRTAAMVIRLWNESDHESELRARITQTVDTMTSERSFAAGGSAEDICDAVKVWVHAFVDPSSPHGNGALPAAIQADRP